MTCRAVLVAACRTPVAPRGGALKTLQADELAAPVLSKLLVDASIAPGDVDHVILGNALYGGGNPARMAALRAGLPVTVPAMTLDTQCCSGLDAIIMGVRLIEAGAAKCVIAGGTESFSRSPIRLHRPTAAGTNPVPYHRPAFAPLPYSDPDLTDAAASLAAREKISRQAQSEFAVASHKKAMARKSATSETLVRLQGCDLFEDPFSRALSLKTAMRSPVLAGDSEFGLSAATIACEADAAAAVVLVAEDALPSRDLQGLRVCAAMSLGGLPSDTPLVPIALGKRLLKKSGVSAEALNAIEVQEAYAAQAMMTIATLNLPENRTNALGGALARGHPIGASGAILAVNLFELLTKPQEPGGSCGKSGLALIAAAGGLASGLLVRTIPG